MILKRIAFLITTVLMSLGLVTVTSGAAHADTERCVSNNEITSVTIGQTYRHIKEVFDPQAIVYEVPYSFADPYPRSTLWKYCGYAWRDKAFMTKQVRQNNGTVIVWDSYYVHNNSAPAKVSAQLTR